MSTASGERQAYPHPHVNEAWLAQTARGHHRSGAADRRCASSSVGPRIRASICSTSCAPIWRPGHNVRATVFIQCGFAYRTDGPAELRPVGETEYVAASPRSAEAAGVRACAGIVGYCDFRLGEPIDAVLEAHIAGRRRPLQGHPPERRLGCGGRHDHVLAGAAASADGSRVPRRAGTAAAVRAVVRMLAVSSAVAGTDRSGARVSRSADLANHCGGPIGVGPISRRNRTRRSLPGGVICASWRSAPT